VRELWRRAPGRGVRRWEAWCFLAGWATLALALLSPVHALGEALFSAHMVQHLVLIVVAAPLLAAGAPLLACLWAVPDAPRRRWARAWARARRLRAAVGAVTAPGVVWVLHVAALWAWHLPRAYDLALRDGAVHALEHASFLGTAVLFWWVALQPVGRRRLGRAAAMLYVFAAGMQGAALGALLTFARVPWYLGHGTAARAWGLTPLEDQQVAGLIMWVPGGLAYLIAAGALFVAWLRGGGAGPFVEEEGAHAATSATSAALDAR